MSDDAPHAPDDGGERIVLFDALPRAVRERLVGCLARTEEPAPLLEDRTPYRAVMLTWGGVAAAGAGIAGLLLAGDFGVSVLGREVLPFLVGLAALAVAGGLGMAARRAAERLPYAPGRYVLPLDFVDARGPKLRVVPLRLARDVRVVHETSDGAYARSKLHIAWGDGGAETFAIDGREEAEAAAAAIRGAREALEEAVGRDGDALRALDPFFEVRAEDAWNAAPPANVDGPKAGGATLLTSPIARAAIALVVGGALATGGLELRNRASDDAMFARVQREDTEAGYEKYLATGVRHVDVVRGELLPRAGLASAKRLGTVKALRDHAARVSGTPAEAEARAALHARYQATLASFREQAASEKDLLPFIERLLAWYEAHEITQLEARFSPPSTGMLTFTDNMLADPKVSHEGTVAKVAPHFDKAHAAPREAAIVAQLADGFAAVFPEDMLRIVAGGRVGDGAITTPPPPADSDAQAPVGEPAPAPSAAPSSPALGGPIVVPTLDIAYRVGWSGDIFGTQKSNRKFVGILIAFDVTMRIPGEAGGIKFTLNVAPPEEFDVNYDDSGPSEGRVYDAMAERAFDQLSEKLRATFFRAGTAAFRGKHGPQPSP